MEARILYGIAAIAVVVYLMMYVHQVADFRRNGIHPIGKGTVMTTWMLLILALGGFGGGWYQSRSAKAETKPAQHRVTKVKHHRAKTHVKHDDESSARAKQTKHDDESRSTTRQARADDEPTTTKASRTRQTTSSASRRQATRSRATTTVRNRSSSQVASTPASTGATSNDDGGATGSNQGSPSGVAVVSDTSVNQGAGDDAPAPVTSGADADN